MGEQLYKDSVYRFTDPVRYFKANDHYYFEVDNIPLKQLMENCNWLRDQLAKEVEQVLNIRRYDIQELKPYANGSDRVIRVKPGRFTGRINDAANKDPLQFLRLLMGEYIGHMDIWGAPTNNPGHFPIVGEQSYNDLLLTVLAKFKSNLAQDALGMTGLAERAFTFPVIHNEAPASHGEGAEFTWGALVQAQTPHGQLGYAIQTVPNEASVNPAVVSEYTLWANIFDNAVHHVSFETYGDGGAGAVELPLLESTFIKKWRGIARLAIVDVPDELTIEVPPFTVDDFNYINEGGEEVVVDGVQNRIDMVFIYSKPVDSSAVTINTGNSTSKITRPTLGIVRGAGIKMTYKPYVNAEAGLNPDKWNAFDAQGNPQILASPGDQANEDMGFTAASANDVAFDVRGSFPSPDDILNIAPLLSEKLESTAFELVGQSILPVAYVWVQSQGSEAANGAAIVLTTDVIDIRPLFRTAELAYNERAGLAAAMPQISLANPVTGKNQLDYEIKRLSDDVNVRLANLEFGFEAPENITTLATGYVMGGWNFGPEGAIYDYWAQQNNAGEGNLEVRSFVRDNYGYGMQGGDYIPNFPDWDLSTWVTDPQNQLGFQGEWPNDRLNTYNSQSTANGAIPGQVNKSDATIVAGSFYDSGLDNRIRRNGSSSAQVPTHYGSGQNNIVDFTMTYVSKKIYFIRPPWLLDYTIDVEYVNCKNQTGMSFVTIGEHDRTYQLPGHSAGLWVEKGPNYFTIYSAATVVNPDGQYSSLTRMPAPHYLSNSGPLVTERGGVMARFAGYMVPVEHILYSNTTPVESARMSGHPQGYYGNPRIGKCTYPTILWKFTGIPAVQGQYHYTNLNSESPPIELRGT